MKEKGQYVIGFGVIALMLYVVGFPIFLLAFFGALAFFVWKVFVSESRGETRRIFEFYLTANEILRDDDRRWFGFEIKDAIARGEGLVKSMVTLPPLVHFALGALYQKIEDHSSAARHLAVVVEETSSDESAIMFPSKDLREYTRTLRRIERAPGESPQTSAAIRSLERSRKNRASKMLAHSREVIAGGILALTETNVLEDLANEPRQTQTIDWKDETIENVSHGATGNSSTPERDASPTPPDGRKTISEVLHDIYDDKIQ